MIPFEYARASSTAEAARLGRDGATFIGTANRRDWYLLDAGDLLPGCDPRTEAAR